MKHKISNKEKKGLGFVFHELVAENKNDKVLLGALYQVIPGIAAKSPICLYNYSGFESNPKSLTFIVYPEYNADETVPNKVFENSE